MDRHEANRQLCKMQGEVADRLGLKTICTCGDTAEWAGEVPDEVITELWTLIADGYLFRHLREIISKERPKGRRLNVEELDTSKSYPDTISMGCGAPKQVCSICEGVAKPGEFVIKKARRLIDALDDPDPVTAMISIATEHAKNREDK